MQARQLLIAAVAALGLALWGLPGSAYAAAALAFGSHDLAAQGTSSVTAVRYHGGAVGLSGSHARFSRPGRGYGFGRGIGWGGRGWGWGSPVGLGLGWGGWGWGSPVGVGYGLGYRSYGYGGCGGGWGW